MRVALLTLTLAVVLAASALNLALGAMWAAGAVGLLWLRRRAAGVAPVLVLALAITALVALGRAGWMAPPPPTRYTIGEWTWLVERLEATQARERPAGPGGQTVGAAGTARVRLEARRAEELRYTAADFERRAGAAVALSRAAGRLRQRAPGEVAALEEAARRLALTLTAPEFRDLAGRRARLQAWFVDLDARLATARDEAEIAAVMRALDPVAMAQVSLRALREDLARVDAATLGLVRALAGAGVTVTATSTLDYAEERDELISADRYAVTAAPPLKIVRLEVGVLRRVDLGASAQTLSYEIAGTTGREVPAGTEIVAEQGVGRVVVMDRRVQRAGARRVGSLLKRIPFIEIVASRPTGVPGELGVTVALGEAGLEALLPVAAPPPRLERVTVPRYALHFVGRADGAPLPGTVATGDGADSWTAADGERAADPRGSLVMEVAPPTALLRNRLFVRVQPYLYVPNLTAILVVVAVAALAVVLMGRRRSGTRGPGPTGA